MCLLFVFVALLEYAVVNVLARRHRALLACVVTPVPARVRPSVAWCRTWRGVTPTCWRDVAACASCTRYHGRSSPASCPPDTPLHSGTPGDTRYTPVHSLKSRDTPVHPTHPSPLRYTPPHPVHPGTPRDTQRHPGTPRDTPVQPVHPVHTGTSRDTPVHPATPRHCPLGGSHSLVRRRRTERAVTAASHAAAHQPQPQLAPLTPSSRKTPFLPHSPPTHAAAQGPREPVRPGTKTNSKSKLIV